VLDDLEQAIGAPHELLDHRVQPDAVALGVGYVRDEALVVGQRGFRHQHLRSADQARSSAASMPGSAGK